MDNESALARRGPLRLTLAALLASVCVSFFLVVKLQPSSAGVLAFLAVWLAVPHAAMASLLLARQRREKPLLPWSDRSARSTPNPGTSC